MIYRKHWHRSTRTAFPVTYEFDGWFLLGFLPLYIHRKRI